MGQSRDTCVVLLFASLTSRVRAPGKVATIAENKETYQLDAFFWSEVCKKLTTSHDGEGQSPHTKPHSKFKKAAGALARSDGHVELEAENQQPSLQPIME